MVTRSPLTGTIFNSSAGGHFGKELKFAGMDALIIKGRAQEPIYLSIKNDDIGIRKANRLWGKNVRECTGLLKPEGSVACIGRAGEKLVPLANIMNDYIHACVGLAQHKHKPGLDGSIISMPAWAWRCHWLKDAKSCCGERKQKTWNI